MGPQGPQGPQERHHLLGQSLTPVCVGGAGPNRPRPPPGRLGAADASLPQECV